MPHTDVKSWSPASRCVLILLHKQPRGAQTLELDMFKPSCVTLAHFGASVSSYLKWGA